MNEKLGLLRRLDATGVPGAVARVVLGYLFIDMGWHKAADPVGFLKLLREYHIFPDTVYAAMNFVAITLPWLEIFCGVLLLLVIAVRGTALVLFGMLVSFTIAVAWRAIGIYGAQHVAFCSIKFDCGCGGGEVFICRKLLENTGLILLSAYLLWSRPGRFALLPNLIPGRKRISSPVDRPAVKE